MTDIALKPIGRVVSTRTRPVDDAWDSETSRITLDPKMLGADAAKGLASFSHIEVIFLFDQVTGDRIESGARRPRNNPDWPEIGILAQRGKNRPNRLGLTICEVLTVEGMDILVRGLDAIDGTPVLDIKPVMSGFLPRGDFREPAWAQEIMADYW